MIKTFNQFTQDKPNTIEEGLFDAIKGRKQILDVQSQVADAYEKLIEENPKKFKDGKSVMAAVADFARETYKKTVTAEGVLSFAQWWKDFEKAHAYMLDRTIFNQ